MIFGGYNETQVVGGEKGLKTIPMISEKLNPTMYWGVPAHGFRYGNTIILNPMEIQKPVLTVVDSGTTLILFP